MRLDGDFADAGLGHVADGEDEVLELVVGDARQEVGLVLDGVDGGAQPLEAVTLDGGGIVAGGGEVELVAPALLEESELDHAVAHDVGVGGEALSHGLEGILHHVVPIFLVERDHLEGEAVAGGDALAHLDVFLGGAAALVVVAADAYVEQMQVMALLHESVHGHGAVDAA